MSPSEYPRPAALRVTPMIKPLLLLSTSNVAPLPPPAVVDATPVNDPASSDVNVRLMLAVAKNAADNVT